MNLKKLEKQLGFTFKDQALIESALTHESYLNEHDTPIDSYERLEFFGDAILEFVASECIFSQYTDVREGRLTEIRAALVRTETLSRCAQKLSLGMYIRLSKGEEVNSGRTNENILADTLEALIAVIYFDQGLEAVKLFFNQFLKDELEAIVKNELYIDPKSKFQEFVQNKYKLTPVYKLLSDKAVGSDTIFTMGLFIGDKLITTGEGKNKRIAERVAAVNALGKLAEL